MRPSFSELQYSYSVTKEIEDKMLPISLGVPYFPSLREEYRKGYDVLFNTSVAPIYLQYKVSDFMQTKRANHWDLFNDKYYKFDIYHPSKSPQHNLLKDLSKINTHVYYCASAIFKYEDFTRFHLSKQICRNSVFINFNQLPIIFDKHTIIFNKSKTKGYFCSEPKEILLSNNLLEEHDVLLHKLVGKNLYSVVEDTYFDFISRDYIFHNFLDYGDFEDTDNFKYFKGKIEKILFNNTETNSRSLNDDEEIRSKDRKEHADTMNEETINTFIKRSYVINEMLVRHFGCTLIFIEV
jgi:hypothetical protein